jgi:hypothetical protein
MDRLWEYAVAEDQDRNIAQRVSSPVGSVDELASATTVIS